MKEYKSGYLNVSISVILKELQNGKVYKDWNFREDMDIKITKKSNGICNSYDSQHRFYINAKNSPKGSHIFDLFDVYFSGNISNQIKCATEKGIKNLINATGLCSSKINYLDINSLNKFEIQKGNGEILANVLSGYGYKIKAYQILIGNFDLNGLNGVCVDKAIIINNYNNPMIHEFLVSHELGHIFKAIKRDRKNITNALGLHCNDIKENKITPCAMRQDLTNKHLEELSKVGGMYCYDCAEGMKEYIKTPNFK